MSKSAQIGKYVYSTKPIGKGAFSKVYKGFNSETDELIAIKIIDKIQLKPELHNRIQGEIKLLVELQHPHIVEFKTFLEDEDCFYLILEYCAAGDLSMVIKREGFLSETTARKYMQQFASALRYLKNKNILHRDLKPQNLLLTGNGQLKMTDFNFARELYETDLAETMCGSPLYMAPEIISGWKSSDSQSYTVKADLWSVGMIMYEMVYGCHPYADAKNVMELVKKITNEPIEYNSKVSADCNHLLKGLLQRKPESRFGWEQFFSHAWLSPNEPTFLPVEQNNMWESVSMSAISPVSKRSGNSRSSLPTAGQPVTLQPRSQPVQIASRKIPVQVFENYVPMGTSPPQYSRSEPITCHRPNQPDPASTQMTTQSTFQPRSAPESKGVMDNIWSYMSNSVSMLKGTLDYLSSN
jgi:serine/threonine protein kinase